MSGRVSDVSIRTEDPAVALLVRADRRADGFNLRLSGGSSADFPFSYEDGARLLDAVRSVGSSVHLLDECVLVSTKDPRFEVGVSGDAVRPLFHFTLRGERALDMIFSLDRRATHDFFCLIRDLLEEQTVLGVMES